MTDKSQTDTPAQCAGVQPSAEQIEAIAKDYAQRWYGDDFALMDEDDKADLRIEAQHWLKCWFALAAQPPAAPVGWQLVPIEPTPGMLGHQDVDAGERTMRKAWRGMLASAPKPPAAPVEKPAGCDPCSYPDCGCQYSPQRSSAEQWVEKLREGTEFAETPIERARRASSSGGFSRDPAPHSPSSADNVGQWQLQHSVPSDGFECFYILKNGLQVAEVSGPQNVENTANMQELVNAANAGRPAADDQLADLVARFSAALLEKLRAAEKKYGWTDNEQIR